MYDIKQDKIIGCKKNSLIWHHENRHRQQFTSKLGKFFSYAETLIIYALCGGFSIVAIFDKTHRLYLFAISGILVLIPTIIILTFEIDAWIYAFIKYFKKK